MAKKITTTEDYSILITDDKLLSKYSHNQLNVLGYLQFKREYYTDYRASHNDFFYVTIDEIRDKTGIKSRDTITLFNRLFLQDGIIDYKSGGKHNPNHYRLKWDIESVDLHNEEADFNHVETPKSDTSIKNEEVKNIRNKKTRKKHKDKGGRKSIKNRELEKTAPENEEIEKKENSKKKQVKSIKNKKNREKEHGKKAKQKQSETSVNDCLPWDNNEDIIKKTCDYISLQSINLDSQQSDTYSLEQTVSGFIEDFQNTNLDLSKWTYFVNIAKLIKHHISDYGTIQYLFNNLQLLMDSVESNCLLHNRLKQFYTWLCQKYNYNPNQPYTNSTSHI